MHMKGVGGPVEGSIRYGLDSQPCRFWCRTVLTGIRPDLVTHWAVCRGKLYLITVFLEVMFQFHSWIWLKSPLFFSVCPQTTFLCALAFLLSFLFLSRGGLLLAWILDLIENETTVGKIIISLRVGGPNVLLLIWLLLYHYYLGDFNLCLMTKCLNYTFLSHTKYNDDWTLATSRYRSCLLCWIVLFSD